jgi:hypothetical protein
MVVVPSVFGVETEIGTRKYEVRAHTGMVETKYVYSANMAQKRPVSTVTLIFR